MGTPRFAAFAIALVASAACTEGDDGGAATATHSQASGVAPLNQLPSPQSTNEDTPLFFSIAGGNALSVSDEDNVTLSVQINVTNGTFTLGNFSANDLTVTGDGTSVVRASGLITKINGALDGARYQPAVDYFGAAELQMNSADSNSESDFDTLALSVTSFNDPPINNVPTGIQAATEDVPRSFNLSIGDVDIAGSPVVVSLTASNNTLITLPTIANLTFAPGSGDGTNDATMTFSGTLPAVNAALNGVVVTAPLNYIGPSTLGVTSNDQGATGGGVPGADNDTINLMWSAVNDAPINSVPGPQPVAEEGQLTFSSANSTALSISDVDATTALVQTTLTVTSGTLTLGNPGLVSFTSGDGSDDIAMTFNGTIANLNSALAGTVYTTRPNFAGTVTLTMVTSDLGNSGSGGARQDSDTVTLTIIAENDAPVISVPGAQNTNEDVARTFSVGNGNAITVSDPDAPSLLVTLTASNGVVTLASRTGLSFQDGDGTADAVMTFSGTLASINTALDGAAFAPMANYYGPASLTVATSDLGATGSGGTKTDNDAIQITVAPINDPPVAFNDALAVAEDAPATDVLVLGNDVFAPDLDEVLTVSGVGSPLHGSATFTATKVTYTPTANYHGSDSFTYTISDGRGGSASATVAVTVSSVNDDPGAVDDSFALIANSVGNSLAVLSNDSATPDTGETLTITAVSTPANGTATITNNGTRISYTSTTDYSGPDTFTYTISDGPGGGVDTATVTIDIAAVISQPVNSLPAPQTIVEDTPLFFSSVAGNAITVTDANNATLSVQVIVTSGIFTLGSVNNLTVQNNGTSSVTLSGTLAALNTGLNGARYTPARDYFGPASLTINSSDTNGESDLDVLTLSVTSFNDAPINTVPTAVEAATEDAPRAFGTISISDVDLSGAALVVTLTANNGTTISLPTTGGLTFSSGDGAGDAAMTFTGALASVNVALNGLTVTAPSNYIGSSTLVITSNDQGSTGAGGAFQDTDTITMSWGAVNDPPVNTVPATQLVVEDTSLVFSSGNGNPLSVNDVDASTSLVQVTLTTTGGTMTLGSPGIVTFTTGDGVLDTTMSFSGTLATLNGALAASTFTPTGNFAGTATLTMITSDLGNAGSGGVKLDTDVVSIVVSAQNDAPVNSVPVAQFTAEDTARPFSTANGNAITVSDVDATSLQVTLTSDRGTVTLGTTANVSFQTGDGTADAIVTFTGTTASVNTALNNTRFAPTANSSGTASLTVTTSDLGATGAGGPMADEDTITINVAPINDPPTAGNDVMVVAEDAAATAVAVLDNDSFAPDTNEVLTVTAVGTPVHGTASTNGTTVSYQPEANYNGPDSFSYTIGDGAGGTATATVAVTVTSVNDAPSANDDTFSVVSGSNGNSLTVLSNDSAAPDVGETLTVSLVGTPQNGTATISPGNTRISYTPTPGYDGADTFTYTIIDGVNGLTATATVTINVDLVITRPVNTLPGPQSLDEDTTLFFLVNNAISVSDDGTQLTVRIQVSNGGTFGLSTVSGLTFSGGTTNNSSNLTFAGTVTALNTALNGARYIPAANFHGAATITINTSDNGQSDLDTLTLSVAPWNDAPVITVPSGIQVATEDVPRLFNTISISDVDLSGAAMLVALTANNGTTVSLPSIGGLTFSAGDGTGDATMSFAGTQASVNVALNNLSVTAPSNYIGPSTLVITSNDQFNTGGGPVGEDTKTITLDWDPANDLPVNGVPPTQNILEEGQVTFSTVAGTALTLSDVDAGGSTVQVKLDATGGLLTLGSPAGVTMTASDGIAESTMTFRGTLSAINSALENTVYTANLDYAQPLVAGVTMTSSDLVSGTTPDIDTVTIVIAAINDAPVITGPTTSSTNEDVARTFSSTQANQIRVVDPDATSVQVSLAASAATLTLGTAANLVFQQGDGVGDETMTFTGTLASVNTALNGLQFIPAAQYSGTASFAISVSDLGTTGAGGPQTDDHTVVVTVVAVNDAPTAVNDTATTSEDAPAIEINVLANDTIAPDANETLTVTAVANPTKGTATIVPGGTAITYTPSANLNGTDTFSYTISDGTRTATASITVTITAVNDPPTANDDTYTVNEGSASNSLTVRSNDSVLPDSGETLTVTAVTTPAHGTATITGVVTNTVINYVPTAGYNGPDAFQYTVTDSNGSSAVGNVTITVTSVNTVPNAFNDTVSLAEDGTRVIAVLSNDTGMGDAPLTIVATVPLHGTAELLGDNTILYTPVANYNGPDSFSYTVTDFDLQSDTATVTITVTAVDDLPIAVADAVSVVEDGSATITVLGNDTGLGDAPVTVVVTGPPAHGTAMVNAGVVTYTPTADYVGADALTYRVTDLDGDVSTAVVTITVTQVNDAPTAVADVATARIAEAVTVDVLGNDTDPDDDTLTVSSVTVPGNGTAAIATGGVLYTPIAGFSGTDTFSYTMSDGEGGTDTATVTVAVGLDQDGDGLLDLDETEVHGTDPAVADSDDDGLDDGEEVFTTMTDPLDDDSDDDGLIDGNEGVTDPNLADSDDDGLQDGTELGLEAAEGDDTAAGFVPDEDSASTTDPTAADTDGGGLDDGVEDADHNGKIDFGETDPNDPEDDVPPDDGGGGGGGCSVGGGTTPGGGLVWLLAVVGLVAVRRRRAR